MQTAVISSAWLQREGRRLDSGPYMSGAIEAQAKLDMLNAPKVPLTQVTLGGANGIFNAPRFARKYVKDARFGIPFLGSTDILDADLTHLPLLSRKQVEDSPKLLIKEGWTLITRSGNTGRSAYSRIDMEGMAGSEHFMRVVPDREKILPGYLYAYLSSKFGVPLLATSTYGAIIQHIEPEHILNLPVPRLGATERSAHDLVDTAAGLRASASRELIQLAAEIPSQLGLSPLRHPEVGSFATSSLSCSELEKRFDAPYHSAAAIEVESQLDACKVAVEWLSSVLVRFFKPPLFKRLWVDGPKYGRQFVSGNDAYRYQAEELRYVSHRTPKFDEFILKRGWVAFQAAGQIYGLFARPLFIRGWLENVFAADDIYRLVPTSETDGGYLYAFFRTPHGQVLLKRQACGNSIPRIWDPHIRRVRIPWPEPSVREEIGKRVIAAHEAIERARLSERQAILLVEASIDRGA